MKFLEKDLEEILFKQLTEDKNSLFRDGSEFYDRSRKYFRQLRIGNYGIADIVGYKKPYFHSHKHKGARHHSCHEITVIELKKDNVSLSAFLQAVKYCKGIKRYFDSRGIYNVKLKIILVGREIDTSSDLVFLPDIFSGDIYLYTSDYDYDGIKYSIIRDYCLRKEGFKND